jgi:hypothetical protein
VAISVTMAGGAAARRAASSLAVELPPPAGPSIGVRAFFDDTVLPVRASAGWQRLTLMVPAWQLRSDRTVWRRMQFQDWDSVPAPVRESALLRMYASLSGREYCRAPIAWAGRGR